MVAWHCLLTLFKFFDLAHLPSFFFLFWTLFFYQSTQIPPHLWGYFWHSLRYLFKYLKPSWEFIGLTCSENILMFLPHVIKNAKWFKYKEVSQGSFFLITIFTPFKDISRIKLSQRLSFRGKEKDTEVSSFGAPTLEPLNM